MALNGRELAAVERAHSGLNTARAQVAQLPVSREKALVFTKLDEAQLWLDQLVREANA